MSKSTAQIHIQIFPLHYRGVKPVETKSQVHPKINFIGPLVDETNHELVSLFFQYNLGYISLFFGQGHSMIFNNDRRVVRSTNNPVFSFNIE